MDINHFKRMDKALTCEDKSQHPTHKVGALICGLDLDGQYFERTKHNFWPDILKSTIGTDKKLGNSSTTIHAEIAALFTVPTSNNADIYITDLPCPNCAKTIIHAGIKNVFIDSHTHNTPLGLKMKPYFNDISMLFFEKAGLGVFEMNSPQKTITTLLKSKSIKEDHKKASFEITPFNKGKDKFIELVKNHSPNRAFAACLAKNYKNNIVFLSAETSTTEGLSKQDINKVRTIQDKYAATLQPINHLLALCAKNGLALDKKFIFSSQTPTAREFVNIIGAGCDKLYIGDKSKCRDEYGLTATKQLQNKNIMDIISIYIA